MKVYLSPPTVSKKEIAAATAALQSGWLAPTGPDISAFEKALTTLYSPHPDDSCVALSSGTAALHLAFACTKKLGLRYSPKVWVSTMTFAAAIFAMDYAGLEPVLVDISPLDFNQDVLQITDALLSTPVADLPSVVLITFLYGCPSPNLSVLYSTCKQLGIYLIVDAAEALGSYVDNESLISCCDAFVLSFNGNKIISTGGGGALLSSHPDWIAYAKFLASQARTNDKLSYFHTEIGFNYRLSNISAAIGVAQLSYLEEKIAKRRSIFLAYQSELESFGFSFQSPLECCHTNYWLSAALVPPAIDVEALGNFLWMNGIECRRFWTPMHLQPFLKISLEKDSFPNANAAYKAGLCLPSGDSLEESTQHWIIEKIREFLPS